MHALKRACKQRTSSEDLGLPLVSDLSSPRPSCWIHSILLQVVLAAAKGPLKMMYAFSRVGIVLKWPSDCLWCSGPLAV